MFVLAGFLICLVLFLAFLTGLEREAERKCFDAIETCYMYSSDGACNERYIDFVCKGVFDEK